MGRALKFFLYLAGGIVVLAVVAAVSFMLLFDPNDFRDRIATAVEHKTGRELIIEGELELSLFPWLAIGIGKTTLGNAPGFGEEPFASFEQARLSVQVLPMLLRREVSVGTAELDSLHLNLAIAADGRSNWDDLTETTAEEAETTEGEAATLDIAAIDISNSSIAFSDAQTGDSYRLTGVNLHTGRVADGAPIPLSGRLDFELQPADISGDFEIETTVMFDADEQVITLGKVEMSVVGIDIAADVEPFSYAGELQPTATIEVDAFSPRSVMQRLNIEVPETADPNALTRLYMDADARVGSNAIALTDVEMVFDETTFKGEMSVPKDPAGVFTVDLAADSINLSRYMAPAEGAASAGGDVVPVEIPVDLIRAFNVRGSLTVEEAWLDAMRFENAELGLNMSNGNLRLHPITATMYDGRYEGDVRINASGNTPVLSVNERIRDVKVSSLVASMFDSEDVSGTINGTFQLSGRGDDLAAIQQSLSGNISMELLDGALEGTDVWHELRKARALLKQEPEPEPVLPARTEFSNLSASGPVKDGVFTNSDFLAELPFMQLVGGGTVDFAQATMDYRLSARFLDKPEFANNATPEELEDFTKVVIPLRISGPLAAPSVKPDVGNLVRERVREEIEKKLFDKLLGGDEEEPEEPEDGAPAEGEEAEQGDRKKDRKKKLEDALKDLLSN